MQVDEKVSIIEAILFANGDPIDLEKISEASGIELETIPKLVGLLNDRYEANNSALKVIKLNKSYQLTTKESVSEYIKASMETKRAAALSQAALETLTIVAYNQPITKSFIEQVRGIDSSSIVNSLIDKGLLEESGRLDVPGRPISYKTTNTFLRCFGLTTLDDLPKISNRNDQVTFDEIKETEVSIPDVSSVEIPQEN